MLSEARVTSYQNISSNNSMEKSRSSRCLEVCSVCGDQSTGFHYEVPSCNGCKTFFRRTIVSERNFKCHKDGNCLSNKEVRCACRSCRFQKCLSVGMNPKAIQILKSSPSGRKNGSISPSNVSSTSPEQSNRRHPYDISSLLSLSSPSCSNNISSPSIQPTSSSSPIPSTSRTPPINNIIYRMSDRCCTLLLVESQMEELVKVFFPTSSSLIDIMNQPSAILHIAEYQKYNLGSPHILETERETNLTIEYAKAFKWFQDMPLTDKLILLSDRLLPVFSFNLALRLANMDDHPAWSTPLHPIIETIRKSNVDPIAFALLKMIILLDCDLFALTTEGKAMLQKERNLYLEDLREHFYRRETGDVSRLFDHLSLMWTVTSCSCVLRQQLLRSIDTLPNPSLTRQLIESIIF